MAAGADEVKKLEFLVGEWEGQGWMEIGGRKFDFTSSEKVRPALSGNALLVEGMHKSLKTERAEPRVVHDALAVVSYDEKAKEFRFDTFVAGRGNGNHKGRMEGDAFIWMMDSPQRKSRYTIRLNEKKEWHEVGESSTDGVTWKKFFEMTLKRVK